MLGRQFRDNRAPAFNVIADALDRHAQVGGTVLDVGCAAGAFLQHLKPELWDRRGVEPSLRAVDLARVQGLNVQAGLLQDLRLESASIEAVTLIDVLAQLEEPRVVLAEMRRILVKDGVALIEIPGYRWRMITNAGLVTYIRWRCRSTLNPRDFVFFPNDRDIRRLFQATGFRLVETVDIPPNSYGSRRQRLAQRLYFIAARATRRLTGGRIRLATKLLFVARPTDRMPPTTL